MTLHVGHEPALTPPAESSLDACDLCGAEHAAADLFAYGAERYCPHGCAVSALLQDVSSDLEREPLSKLIQLRESVATFEMVLDRVIAGRAS